MCQIITSISVTFQKGVLLINQCCTLIQPDDDILVSKCCRLITNLVTHQHLQLEGRTLKITIDWCMKALKQVDKPIMLEILITIEALLRIDPRNTKGVSAFMMYPVELNGFFLNIFSC